MTGWWSGAWFDYMMGRVVLMTGLWLDELGHWLLNTYTTSNSHTFKTLVLFLVVTVFCVLSLTRHISMLFLGQHNLCYFEIKLCCPFYLFNKMTPCIHFCVHVCVSFCVCAYVHICNCVCFYICVQVYACVCVCVCMFVLVLLCVQLCVSVCV